MPNTLPQVQAVQNVLHGKERFIQCIGLYMAILIGFGRCVHGLGIGSYI